MSQQPYWNPAVDRSGNTEFPGKSPQDVPRTPAVVEAVVLQTGFRRFYQHARLL